MFPGQNGKRKQPDWLRHIHHCRPVKRAAFALDAPLGRLSPPAHALPALQVVHAAGLGDGTRLCMLLVTVQPVKAVIAQIKDQVYASIANYISVAKGKTHGSWTYLERFPLQGGPERHEVGNMQQRYRDAGRRT